MADADAQPAANGAASSFMQNASAAVQSVANGPLLQNVREQHAKTSSEISALASSRKTPDHQAATGQPLTHYHSFFTELVSWNNPRASGLAYAATVSFIFLARYFDLVRHLLRFTWMTLLVTVGAEVVGKTVLNNGFASQFRPRNYYMVSRETLDAMIGDVHELVNFFVLEAQRVLFAENVAVSSVAAVTAFFTYYLAKIVPFWGLALIFTTVAFFAPLVYKLNKEAIDDAIQQASDVVGAQTEQLREVANKHTAQAANMTKQYVGDYTAKAQQMLRRRSGGAADEKLPDAPSDLPFKPAPHHEPSEREGDAIAAH